MKQLWLIVVYNDKQHMIEQDIAKDNLRSCSQQTHYLFDWTQTISNPTPPLQILQTKKTFNKITSQLTSDFQSLKIKLKRSRAKVTNKKIIKEKLKQKRQQVLCRFEYPVIDQTDQSQFWTKMKQEANHNKKIQSLSKQSSRKKLADLVEQQIKKLNIRNSQGRQTNKITPFGLKQHILLSTNTLPTISKRKIKPFAQQEYETRPMLIDTSERQQSAIRRRSSMPIIKYKYKF